MSESIKVNIQCNLLVVLESLQLIVITWRNLNICYRNLNLITGWNSFGMNRIEQNYIWIHLIAYTVCVLMWFAFVWIKLKRKKCCVILNISLCPVFLIVIGQLANEAFTLTDLLTGVSDFKHITKSMLSAIKKTTLVPSFSKPDIFLPSGIFQLHLRIYAAALILQMCQYLCTSL